MILSPNPLFDSSSGSTLTYDYMVLATGLQLRYDLVQGLDAHTMLHSPGLCSIYSPDYVEKTWQEIQRFSGGTAIFTHPNTPIKCAGATQKICYLAEEAWREVSPTVPI